MGITNFATVDTPFSTVDTSVAKKQLQTKSIELSKVHPNSKYQLVYVTLHMFKKFQEAESLLIETVATLGVRQSTVRCQL